MPYKGEMDIRSMEVQHPVFNPKAIIRHGKYAHELFAQLETYAGWQLQVETGIGR